MGIFDIFKKKSTKVEEKPVVKAEPKKEEIKPAPKKAPKVLSPEEEKKRRRKELREQNIFEISKKTGWDRATVILKSKDAKNRIGITLNEYNRYDFFDIPIEEQQAKYDALKEEKRLKKERKLINDEKKKQRYISKVVDNTGWTREHAEEMMQKCEDLTGNTFEYYAMNRFWELTLEEQKTYFSKGDAEKLRNLYNKSPKTLRLFMNKDLFCERFEDYLGRPWMSTVNIKLDEFKEKFGKEHKLIYKPRSSTGGHGIKVWDYDENTIEDVYNELKEMPAGLIEGFLVQHPDMQQFSVKSVNTIRVVTISTMEDYPGIEKDKLYFVYAGLRMGYGDSYVDNLHGGGMIAGVDMETGELITHASNYNNEVFEKHPDTGATIKGFKIPYFQEMKDMIEKACKGIYGYFGWDIAITENGPVVIEVNTHPGAECLQTAYVPMGMGMHHVVAKFLLEEE